MEVTDELRAALRELIANPSNPAIFADDANRLIELGLAALWGSLITITRAGRVVAFANDGKSAT
jgi:hypothetical protein